MRLHPIQSGIIACTILLVVVGILGSTGLRAEDPNTAKPVAPLDAVKFNGYQKLDGIYLFQFYFPGKPASGQPPLKKTEDKLGQGDWGVGAFQMKFVKKLNLKTNVEEMVDESTVELVNPVTKAKVRVPFRRQVDLPE